MNLQPGDVVRLPEGKLATVKRCANEGTELEFVVLMLWCSRQGRHVDVGYREGELVLVRENRSRSKGSR